MGFEPTTAWTTTSGITASRGIEPHVYGDSEEPVLAIRGD